MAHRFVRHDKDGVRLKCDEGNWLVHEQRHPEIKGHEGWVRRTIENPIGIYQSDTHADRRYSIDRTHSIRASDRHGFAWWSHTIGTGLRAA